MDNKYYEKLLIMPAKIEANRKESNDKIKNLTEDLKAIITSTITWIIFQINISESFPYHKDSPKAQDPTNMVPANRKDPPLDGGDYTKIGVMCNIKHDII